MKPYLHAVRSAKKWGGTPDDYLKFHDWFDQTKMALPDMRHRMILHNSFGIFMLEQVFGTYFTNSDGKVVQVRDVGEQHVLDDLGTIPTLDKCFATMGLAKWMGGKTYVRKKISFENVD